MDNALHKKQAAAFVAKRLSELEADAKARGTTLNKAAIEAEIHPSTLYRWKHGQQEPTLYMFERLANAVYAN